MNKKHFFFGMCAALAFAGCSSDDLTTGEGTQNEAGQHYLAVSIVATPDAYGTKAVTDADNYTDGEPAENAIKKVRFYFFGDDGSATAVKSNGSNYYDWTPADTDKNLSGDAPNVEESLNATIVISTKDGDRMPSKMLAVLNPDAAGLTESPKTISLEDLRNKTADYTATLSQENGFVMVSSVYASAGKDRVSTSTIQATNMATSESEAKANPVVVYVERNVAKVSVGFTDAVTKTDDDLIALTDKNGNALTATVNGETKQIYLKTTGWNLTANTELGYLSKHIDPTWKSTLFQGGQEWNYYQFFRSFWAFNVNSSGTTGNDIAGYDYKTYNEIGATALNGSSVIYTNENAASTYSTGMQRAYPTQVIVGGQLGYLNADNQFTALELADYAGVEYIGETALKNQMAQFVNLYKMSTSLDGKTITYTKVTPDELEFVTESASQNYKNATWGSQDNKGGRYYVRLALTDEAKAQTGGDGNTVKWSLSNAEGSAAATDAQIAEALQAAGHAKLWKDGMTYYYFKVRHLADKDEGMYGVVRNHFYQCSISAVYGLGTPVYNPDEVIYPETPVDNDSYVAAQIKILSWRVVPSTVTLGE